MGKKIRFPLKLSEGAEVRTLEELREHFDLEAVLEYYKNGKLLTWLEDRYLEGEAEAVQALDEASPDFQRRLCEVFQVEYTGGDIDLEAIERRQERLKRLRSITDEAEYDNQAGEEVDAWYIHSLLTGEKTPLVEEIADAIQSGYDDFVVSGDEVYCRNSMSNRVKDDGFIMDLSQNKVIYSKSDLSYKNVTVFDSRSIVLFQGDYAQRIEIISRNTTDLE